MADLFTPSPIQQTLGIIHSQAIAIRQIVAQATGVDGEPAEMLQALAQMPGVDLLRKALADSTDWRSDLQRLAVAVGAWQSLDAGMRNGAMMLWNSPYGASPQDVFDGLDGYAIQLVQFGVALADTLSSALPESQRIGSTIPVGYGLQANEDGTVTVIES